ncbi:flagellin N-terminal helical domain-containing protein [Nocardioides sp. URHA0020]|uniref:flagellin N-terminal helical domain-containing protein n=1 Tax=Nocardioides sp. URHA0020 TaxID=1380392 RepID=UPI00048D003D|nr:flagellin [Nocardioides sp. URHA0020]
MSLRINQNIDALNSYRNLSVTQGQMSKSLEKLSSGYRINRAADDAAGLAISEGLRSQVGGLKVAVRNTQDGVSVVQTAEGALTETHSILQRMRDLSVQAANDGGLNDDAKGNIQSELTQLNSELDRIASTTKFNGTSLLDGSYNGTFQVGADSGQTISVAIGSAGKGMDAGGLGVAGVDVTKIAANGATGARTTEPDASTAAVITVTAANSGDFSDTTGVLDGSLTSGGKTLDLGTLKKADTTKGWDDTANAAVITSALDKTFGTGKITAAVGTTDVVFTGSVPGGTGSTADIASADVTFSALSGASGAIDKIDAAIKTVSTTRANLGALQNRFEHTVNNLNVAVENLSASESRIRDTDMASEMMNFTRSQILSQAGTAMLAQANQAPQGVLSLLR